MNRIDQILNEEEELARFQKAVDRFGADSVQPVWTGYLSFRSFCVGSGLSFYVIVEPDDVDDDDFVIGIYASDDHDPVGEFLGYTGDFDSLLNRLELLLTAAKTPNHAYNLWVDPSRLEETAKVMAFRSIEHAVQTHAFGEDGEDDFGYGVDLNVLAHLLGLAREEENHSR